MSRRKTKKKSTTRRRKRVSGVSGDEMQVVLGLILGVGGTLYANEQIAKATKPIDPKIIAIGELLLGFFGPRFIKGALVKGIGYGVMAAGSAAGLKEFDIISGLPLISGYRDMKTINGVPDVVQMYMPKKNAVGSDFSTAETLSGLGMFNGRYDE